ncbi:lymphocyte antigen 75-like [Melanotaenia boesemani]|uniref:lymphocyte antigen 75-like n=1 Tax=Melanotaenia boesemani TaxID=1250792 RepID=UPI001C03BF76|nr:lymphocyte antigen 75-like [Melanotaenia boesemani]XP_041845121.1 lymphocyte antigen 75-like [Melanotaenia boesemani]
MTGLGLVLLLLVSGCLVVCDGTISRFRYVGLSRNWTEAQSYCREMFSDLATIYNDANMTEAQKAAGSSNFWIGLLRGPWYLFQENYTSATVSMWNTSKPGTGLCPAIGRDGRLYSKDCTNSYPFFCSSANGLDYLISSYYYYYYYYYYTSSYYYYDWNKSQTYCKTYYKNLSNIKSRTQYIDLTTRIQSYSFAWIGLDSQFFRWSDGNSSSYGPWDSLDPGTGVDCAVMNSSSGSWFWRPCNENNFFLCRADIQPPKSMVRTVKVRMRGGSADLNDPVVQDKIIEQLRQRMEERGVTEEVKLTWKTQPDGKVFHREGETAPPGVCGTEDVCVTV